MNKAIVKQVNRPLDTCLYQIYAVIEGEERLINLFSYKLDADPEDNYWGENVAKRNALEFAKKWEQFGGKETVEVIYETPEQ